MNEEILKMEVKKAARAAVKNALTANDKQNAVNVIKNLRDAFELADDKPYFNRFKNTLDDALRQVSADDLSGALATLRKINVADGYFTGELNKAVSAIRSYSMK